MVSEETQSEKARRIFRNFDPEGNGNFENFLIAPYIELYYKRSYITGFIPTVLLSDVLRSLDLVSEPE